jgi:hypothetical protein
VPGTILGYTSNLGRVQSTTIGDYEYAYSDRNSNKGTMMPSSNLVGHQNTQFSEHFYEQPMVVFPSSGQNSPTASTSAEKAPFLPPRSRCSSPKPKSPPSHLQLPKTVDNDSISWAAVSSAGAKITVPHRPVSLTVPQGALTLQQDMYMSVLDRDRYRPQLDSSQTAVTPVVQCGPANLTHCLQKPVVLSIPHVIGKNKNKSRLMVLYCADLDHSDAEWQIVRDNSDESSVDMQVDSSSVHLVTERLGAYVLVANVTDLNTIGGGGRGSGGSRSSSGCSSLGSPTEGTQLTPASKQMLSKALDVGGAWRTLSDVMGAEHYASFVSTQRSPTEALINLWEAKNFDPEPARSLAMLLRQIGREDVATELEKREPTGRN